MGDKDNPITREELELIIKQMIDLEISMSNDGYPPYR